MDWKAFDRTSQSTLYESAKVSISFDVTAIQQYLTVEEELQIYQQFHNTWRWNKQVMWSGMYRKYAQKWADEHGMVTLTTAMGPLMDPEHPLCLRKQKLHGEWSQYIRGASAVFAWYILRGEKVIVLSPPPPERFHPSGQTNYQAIEEPILKGEKRDGTRLRLEMVHPMVEGAENFTYQIWPVDKTTSWVERFGTLVQEARCWRKVKSEVREILKCAVKVGVAAQENKIDKSTQEVLKEKAALREEKALEEKASKEKKALKKKASKEKKALKKASKQKKKLRKHAMKETRVLREDRLQSGPYAIQPSRTRSGCCYSVV